MNKIWSILIILCLIYGIINNNYAEMIDGLFDVPKNTIHSLLKLMGTIMILTGILNIAVEARIIDILTSPIKKIVSNIFDIPKKNDSIKYICANIIANILGFSMASMPLAIKAYEEMKKENQKANNYILFALLNISCFTVLPISFITIRNINNSKINIQLIPIFIFVSFITTLISILINKIYLSRIIYE